MRATLRASLRHASTALFVIVVLAACSGASESETTTTAIPPTNVETTSTPPPSVTVSTTSTSVADSTSVPPPSTEAPMLLWERTYGSNGPDRGVFPHQTADGGFAIVGLTSGEGAGGDDVYLVRTDADGEHLWTRTYGGRGGDAGWSVVETADSGFLIAGYTTSFGAGGYDIYLVRTDSSGEVVWEKTYGGEGDEYGWALRPVASGGFVVAGETDSFGAGGIDAYLLRIDDDGEELWSRTYGGEESDRTFGVQPTSDDEFVLVGTTQISGAGGRDAYVVKVDDAGDLIWERSFGDSGDDVAHAVDLTPDGGFIVIGYTDGFGAAGYDTYLTKLDAAGEAEWHRVFGGPREDRTITGVQSPEGGYVLVGRTRSFDAAGWDIYLVATDGEGSPVWTRTLGGDGEDMGYTVQRTADGGFVVTGHTKSGDEPRGDVYVARFSGG